MGKKRGKPRRSQARAASRPFSQQRREYLDYLASPEWKARRLGALSRAEHKCEACASPKQLHVHHLTYKRFRNEIPEDLQVLCRNCHAKAHGKYIVIPEVARPAPVDRDRKFRAQIASWNDDLHKRQKEARKRREAKASAR